MRSVLVWSDASSRSPVWDLAFKGDGSVLAAATGRDIVLLDAGSGEHIKTKTGHGGDVYTLSASKDGAFLASGGADKSVCVWTWDLALKYTYTHADSIQALAFNPVLTHVLASCSAVDFAVWTMPSSSLRKIRVTSRITCAAWSSDGQTLALGHMNGTVSLRDTTGAERSTITRQGPVWDVVFNVPSREREDAGDVLCVASWDGALSFYSTAGAPVGKERVLDYDPTSVRPFSNGEYLCVCGSARSATLMTRDGVKLNVIGEGKDWFWRAAPRPKSNYVAVAGNDGSISMYSIVFSTVHGLYAHTYAFRDAMTDVVVQHLVSEQRVRIKCRDYVKKIAVYGDRLAVQLPDRIIIYELAPSATTPSATMASGEQVAFNMQYRVKDRIFAALECNLLVVTSRHVILCQEKKLQLYDFSGVRAREWVLEAVIRYIKVVGGPPGREGLLVGLKNGAVLKIFVDNPFPQLLIKHKTAIRCLDLSMSRRKLAVVDEAAFCVVYDVITKESLFSEPGANSVAWNSEMEDMLCFSGNGQLAIKTETFPLHTQRLQGFVVGFMGSKIFCLHSVAMQTIDVPQSASLYRYIDARDWELAYRVACLGVTESDWRHLGESALRAMQLPIARAAFARLSDMRYLELLHHIETARKSQAAALRKGAASGDDARGGQNDAVFLAEILAYGGKFSEAAKQYLRAGAPEKAIEMFTDLRLWNEARKFAEETGRVDVNALMLKQAAWCEETGDVKAAATILSAVGQAPRAVRILGERGMYNQLIELIRTLSGDAAGSAPQDKVVREALQLAGDLFRKADLTRFARECFVKLGDSKALLQLHLDAKQWAEALAIAVAAETEVLDKLKLAQKQASGGDTSAAASVITLQRDAAAAKELVVHARVSHAEWLASVDRFEDAQREFEAAERPDLSASILEMLAANAVSEERYSDASFHYLRLSMDVAAAAVRSTEERGDSERRRAVFLHLAHLYRAYGIVHEFLRAPFCSVSAPTIFFAAKFVLSAGFGQRQKLAMSARTQDAAAAAPVFAAYQVSAMHTLYALGVQSMALAAFRTARFALDRCAPLLLPPKWRDALDVAHLRVASKPFADPDRLVHCCYRCGAVMNAVNVTPAALMSPTCRRPGATRGTASSSPPTNCYPTILDGDSCPTCGHSFVRSMLTFDTLPLVEFQPDCAAASLSKVIQGILEGGGGAITSSAPSAAATERITSSVQSMSFAPQAHSSDAQQDAFARALAASTHDGTSDDGVLRVTVSTVMSLRPSEVFVVWPGVRPADDTPLEALVASVQRCGLRVRFFKNVVPEITLSQCKVCQLIAEQQDMEFAVVREGVCPFCRSPADVIDI